MKILIMNPNGDKETNRIIERKAEGLHYPGMTVTVKNLEAMPKLVSSWEDVAEALPGMIGMIRESQEYDGYIVGCHMDPNLEILKGITDKPVVGIGEASVRMASMQCSSFAVISPSRKSELKKVKLIHHQYCMEQYQGTKVPEGFREEDVIAAAKNAADQWNVDGIVLGCANYALMDGSVERACGVKCFDGISCALVLAAGEILYNRQKKV